MTDWRSDYDRKLAAATDAVRLVRSGDHVFIGSGCAEPQTLVQALAAREELNDVEILHILTLGVAPYADPRFPGRFRHNAFFIGPNVRDAVNAGRADYTPVFLSEIPSLFRSGRMPIDVALIQTSPPDRAGYVSLGISVDVVKSACECAELVLAEINPYMPRTHGDGFLSIGDLDAIVETNTPLIELPAGEPDAVCREIAAYVASLIPDAATIQLGIGEIPQALTPLLASRHDLGIHTEMFSDGVVDLVDAGVVNGRKKTRNPGKVVSSFCMGSRRLYDFVNDNPMFEFRGVDYVNDPFVISQNDLMMAINSALEVDLTGQVCADSIGARFFSGIGGQVDFMRGARRSRGGRPIIAMRSTAKNGTVSRIVPSLAEGAGIVTSRGDVHYVVTEYGVANLYGRTVRERSLALISIAHPDFREELLNAARARHFVAPTQVPLPGGRPYPAGIAATESLRDGRRVALRALKPDDERALRDLFYSHSEETIYLRYGTPLKRLTAHQIQHFVTLDYESRMAIGAFLLNQASPGVGAEEGALIGVARYDLDRATNLAECAFVVHDDFQSQGLGSLLLQRLMRIARDQGVLGLTAQVLARNARMLHLFSRWCSPLDSRISDGTCYLSFRFAEIDGERRKRRRGRTAKAAEPPNAPAKAET